MRRKVILDIPARSGSLIRIEDDEHALYVMDRGNNEVMIRYSDIDKVIDSLQKKKAELTSEKRG